MKTNLPSFICIGGQRCGSTWLHRVLESHPQVLLSPKESSFFNLRIRTKGIDWYSELFSSSDTDQSNMEEIKKGDITPTYSAMFIDEISLAKAIIPDLKIILIIRNPVDRMISQITRQWTYSHIDEGASTTRNLLALLRQVDSGLSRRLTDFCKIYKNWSQVFGKENILVKSYDSLSANPDNFISEITDFIEVENSHKFSDLLITRKANKSNLKEQVNPFLEWYLAVEWLPMVRKLNQEISEPVLLEWIEKMEKIKEDYNLTWIIIYCFHKVYFFFPYYILYRLFNIARSMYRKNMNNRVFEKCISPQYHCQ